MMKHLKFFLFALSALVCLNACNENAPSGGGGDDPKPGHIEWKFNSALGVLTISGTGAMPNYTSDNRPEWEEHKDYILEVVIKDGVTSVGHRAFYDYKNLSEVVFPSTLTFIGKYAFYNTGVTEVDLSGTALKQVGSGMFQNCRQLKKVDFSGTALTEIQYADFAHCDALYEAILPSCLRLIEPSAFYKCKVLYKLHVEGSTKVVDLPSEQLTSIGDSAFQNCESLSSALLFPKSMERVGAKAFMGCKALRHVDMSGSGINQLGKQVFEKCEALETVIWKTNAGSLTTVPERAFSECKNLKTVKNFNGARIIEHAAFYECSLLDLSLPSSLVEIGDYAFYNCDGLTEVNIPAGILLIGKGAFQDCMKAYLSSMKNCTKLKVIEEEAFSHMGYDAYGWRSIELPASITTIKKRAFYAAGYGTKLDKIICHAKTPPELGDIAFVNNNKSGSSVKLFVPAASLEAYKSSSWRSFFYYDNIRPL